MTGSVALDQPSGKVSEIILAMREDHDLQTCIQCGTCSGVCPFGYLMDFPPSKMIAALRSGTFERVIKAKSAWLCISCSACTTACPTQIPITERLMTPTKEEMVLIGEVPAELQSALEFSQRYGNPLGESPRKRANWVRDMNLDVPLLDKSNPVVDYLWYVGDYASFHTRNTEATAAFARILNRMGINFGILGKDESSDGESQRLAGETGLFELMAEKNGKEFAKYSFKSIITTDPHAYNALKNHYPEFGVKYPVMHYTEFLAAHMDELRPLLINEIKATVTFHDPCYLGRVNNIIEQPRTLLNAIPGIKVVEMVHNRKTSLCCGGGGGGTWMDGYHWEIAHTRLSEWRVREAMKAGAEILVIACPYEAPRFDDAIKTVKGAEGMVVKDIAELLLESMSS